ncbi:glycosyltransferase [Motilimonas sp. 1_MG-2023]|uniref:glycosyltransferase n=1 Tax=Motilimonas sp. 1_MG-2023 TaxID=3062672 RepID=UPI0026E36C2D|nr:glycosyltransferase [Motilimonas sp. 1_MG-2023]MDO6524551.1 glycosyltransferase [Motilimonas sp. 1_MG-2023]
MQQILVIGYVWPEPNSSAAGSHMMSLLRLFKRQGWQVTFASPAQRTEHMVDLAEEDIASESIALNCSSFDAFISELQPDVVMFDRFMMEEQFGWRVEKNCPNALRILDTEDLQCLRNARREAVKKQRELMPQDLHSDLAKREIAAIYRCDLSLIISSYEMTLLAETFKVPSALLHHLPFMIEPKTTSQPRLGFNERQHFISIGNFRHAPNWDAVLVLSQIWPAIRKQCPDAQLHIYGSYPPPKATALNNPKAGFLVKGWADDAFAVMAKARVCLAPLRFGAGIKGKFIDAMQMGTPSVTTDIGAEGMTNSMPWPGLIANNDDELIAAAIALYQDEAFWQKAQDACQPLLEQVYDASELGKRLIARINALQAHLSEHRSANFTGAMLRHHSMKSTQYMSQWIEEKNKPKQ